MADFTNTQEDCCTDDLGGTVENWGSTTIPIDYCINIPISGWGGIYTGMTSDPCNYDTGAVEQEVESSTVDLGWLNSLLTTLGAISIPFLPWIFGSSASSPSRGEEDNTEQLKSQQGMLILIGFVILIALSVGAYIIIKKRRR